MAKLLHDFRDHDHVVSFRRCILKRPIDRKSGLGDVLAPDIEKREGMCRRFHSGHINFSQLLDVMEHIAQLLSDKGLIASRIAHGIPLGGELDLVDGGTLAHSFAGRKPIAL